MKNLHKTMTIAIGVIGALSLGYIAAPALSMIQTKATESYSAELAPRVQTESGEIYLKYEVLLSGTNNTTKTPILSESTTPDYCTLSWNGSNSQMTINYKSTHLGVVTTNKFGTGSTLWTSTDGVISAQDSNNVIREIQWNKASNALRAVPYAHNDNYPAVYFYTVAQLIEWCRSCSHNQFAFECLYNLLNADDKATIAALDTGYTIPTSDEGEDTPSEITTTLITGTNGSTCTVNGIDGIKVGTNSKGGDMSIKVSAGATKLTIHAAAWKGVSGLSLDITDGTINPSSISLTADDGISNNSPFTLSGNADNFKFEFTINTTAETTFKFTTSAAKRCVVWGVSAE